MADPVGPAIPGLTFVKFIVRGGFAEVFLYEQEQPRRRVAVKVLYGDGLTDSARERFAAEANAMAQLADHPYIVQVLWSDVTADGRPYIVMKYYPQQNLAIRSKKRMSVPEVLQIGIRIASAVETAHRAGILHRDIKPANILTSQYGEPGLTDFGIAATGDGAEIDGLSIPWSPPEILFAHSQGDRSSDVYSLGATIWHLLVGRSPFEEEGGDNSTAALMRRIKEQPPPRTGRDDIPPSLERVLAQAMAKRPEDRPASALELARGLQAVENEMRWATTPLVILADEPEDGEVEVDVGADAAGTRTKAPREVQPHQDPATRRKGPATVYPSGPRAPRPRQGMPEARAAGATVQRVPAAEPAAPPAPEEVPGKKGQSRWLIAGAAVLAIAVVVGGALAFSGHGKGGSATTLITSPPITLADSTPDTPSVSVQRIDPGHVLYTWTGGQPGDTYEVSVNGGTPTSNGSSNKLTLSVPQGQNECISVEIVRQGDYSQKGFSC